MTPTLVASFVSGLNKLQNVIASTSLATAIRKKVLITIDVGLAGSEHLDATTTLAATLAKITHAHRSIATTTTIGAALTPLKLTPAPGTMGVAALMPMGVGMSRKKLMKRRIAATTVVSPSMARVLTVAGTYVRPAPNTDPNSFGTVDVTLDPGMTATQIQNAIDAAGIGGVIEWAGSSHYLINTNLRFLAGQKHYTNNNRIIKCTNTTGMASFIDLKRPKGGGPASTDVFISDLEFWGHINVPATTPVTAPQFVLSPWRNSYFRRVKVKGGSEQGMFVGGDNIPDLNATIDTCEVAYNVYQATGHNQGGWKFHDLGNSDSLVGDAMKVWNTRVHHNGGPGAWWDLGSAGVEVLASEFDNNARSGLHWEVSLGPVYFRDNYFHHNGGAGAIPANGGVLNGLQIVSSAAGTIINNTFQSNNDFGIGFVQDHTPETRSSLYWPALAGVDEGYWFVDWLVHGNVLNGNGVNSETLTNPAIDYSTTHVP